MLRCLYERFSEQGAYFLGKTPDDLDFVWSFSLLSIENGLVSYIWLGGQVNPTFVQSLFGLQTAHIQPEKVGEFSLENACCLWLHFQCRVIELDNPISKNVRSLLTFIRNERDSHMKVISSFDSIEEQRKKTLLFLEFSYSLFNNVIQSNRFSVIISLKIKVLRVAHHMSIFSIIFIVKSEIFFNKNKSKKHFSSCR